MPIRPSLIERAIAIAEEQTRAIRSSVTHIPVIGRSETGVQYGEPVELVDEQAPLVEFVGEGIPTASGVETVSKTKLTFFYSLVVTDRDRFIVPDANGVDHEWNVAKINALLKPDKTPYMVEVWLGDQRISE